MFAKTLMPPDIEMTETELRDNADEILSAVVHDISLAQTSEEESRKSQGQAVS